MAFEDQYNEKQILDKYVKYTCQFVKLLCQLKGQQGITEEDIIEYV